MCAVAFESPVKCLLRWAGEKPHEIYLTQPIGDEVIEYSWSRVADEVSRMARYLTKYPPGSHVAIMSLNCAHWLMADLAIQMAGHVSVPIYPTASEKTVHQVLEHSESVAVFLGKMFEPAKAATMLPAGLDTVAIYQPYPDMPFWDDVVHNTEPLTTAPAVAPNDLVSIVYTSGTTGEPKGVMVSYGAIHAALNLIKHVIVVKPSDRFVSYLPLAHVAERMAIGFGALYNGAHVSFIRSLDTFSDDIKVARPTIFFGVPRIWTKIKVAIEDKFGGAQKFNRLLKLPLVGRLLKHLILKKLGFAEVRFALCAAAAVNRDVLLWYRQLGLKLNEAYGMSETCGLSHMVKQQQDCVGSVGQVIPGCECQIAADGEILLRNPAMMMGYYKQPELTAATIDEKGWLHTGDLGSIDSDGFLYITGRVKDIFKTSKGKYIAPTPIEKAFQSELDVEHLLLMGDGFTQPFLVVSTHDTPVDAQCTVFQSRCQHALAKVNAQLEGHERLSHLFICNKPWSIENGYLTPTMKMKRSHIEHTYHPIAAQYMARTDAQVVSLP